jgi:hypothetical protein
MVYLDDIIVFSADMRTHMERLEELFARLARAGLKIKLSKCALCRDELPFLGHVVSSEGIRTNPDKVRALTSLPSPTNLDEIRRFLGIAGYYRKFIPKFAELMVPLNRMLRKHAHFNWGTQEEAAFRALKESLAQAPTLAYPACDAPFTIQTDASRYAISAALSNSDDLHRPIAFYSRAMSDSEAKYSTTEKECLAVVAALQEWRPYILGRPITVITDHLALKWLLDCRNPKGRLARWAVTLQEYELCIVFRKGSDNVVADALSRNPALLAHLETQQPPEATDPVTTSQKTDPLCLLIRSLLGDSTSEIDAVEKTKDLEDVALAHLPHVTVVDGVVFWVETAGAASLRRTILKPLVPASARDTVLKLYHDLPTTGHLGIAKTFERLRERFMWQNMFADVRQYVLSCESCQARKNPKRLAQGQLQPVAAGEAFETIGIDFVGPLPRTDRGNKYLLVMCDYLTKWPEAFAVRDQEATTVANILVNEIICRYGAPKRILSDRGQNFLSKVVLATCATLAIRKVNTSAYHPETDGLVERLNGTLIQMLTHFCEEDQRNWDLAIPHVLLAYRSAKHSSTDQSPSMMLFGREARLPQDTWLRAKADEICNGKNWSRSAQVFTQDLVRRLMDARTLAKTAILQSQEAYKTAYDKKHELSEYCLGDLVWVFTPHVHQGKSRKLSKLWKGPFTVMSQIGPVTYQVSKPETSSKRIAVHIQRLKHFVRRELVPQDVPVISDSDFEQFSDSTSSSDDEFERFLPKRVIRRN